MRDSSPKKEHRRRPWRDNLEAVVMAIIMAVMLKYFIVEAYQIPTGSMQPTLMGNDETGIKDRIIVDKLSFHFRDPERFEVVVFRYPLDRSKNFIKRICGMPSEHLKISLGDLWTRADASEDYRVLRRPLPIQREVWKRIHPTDPRYAAWKPDTGTRGWVSRGRAALEARGSGSARLPNDGGSVTDGYRDGYPGEMGDVLSRAPRGGLGGNPVGDLRLEGRVRALPGCDAVEVHLREGSRRYRFVLPGPTAPAGELPRIVAEGLPDASRGEGIVATGRSPFRLEAGREVAFAAQNMDDLLSFEVDGEIVAELEVPEAIDQASCFQLRVEGEGADFEELETYRDIFYTEDGKQSEFRIPADCYVMLGDNTQDSSDSRFWTLIRYDLPDGRTIRGNWFPPQNPVSVPNDPEGTRIFLRDEWGELHDFLLASGRTPSSEVAPFVPREMILGRAVAVFWPISFALGVWRLQWVH